MEAAQVDGISGVDDSVLVNFNAMTDEERRTWQQEANFTCMTENLINLTLEHAREVDLHLARLNEVGQQVTQTAICAAIHEHGLRALRRRRRPASTRIATDDSSDTNTDDDDGITANNNNSIAPLPAQRARLEILHNAVDDADHAVDDDELATITTNRKGQFSAAAAVAPTATQESQPAPTVTAAVQNNDVVEEEDEQLEQEFYTLCQDALQSYGLRRDL